MVMKATLPDTIQAEILDAAVRIGERDGWRNLTVRKIAAEVNFSTMVIYNQFENKDDILYALMQRGFRRLRDRWRAVINPADDVRAQLRAIAGAYWDFAFADRPYYEVMFSMGELSFTSERTPAEAGETGALILGAIRAAFAEGNPDVATARVESFFDVFWSYMHGAIALTFGHRIKGGFERSRAVYEAGVELLIHQL